MAAGLCKMQFGSVPNSSTYGYFLINFECLFLYLGEECGDFVHIWYNYQVPRHDALLMLVKYHVARCQIVSNYGHFFIHFVYLL